VKADEYAVPTVALVVGHAKVRGTGAGMTVMVQEEIVAVWVGLEESVTVPPNV
jgi:hypothetical protein